MIRIICLGKICVCIRSRLHISSFDGQDIAYTRIRLVHGVHQHYHPLGNYRRKPQLCTFRHISDRNSDRDHILGRISPVFQLHADWVSEVLYLERGAHGLFNLGRVRLGDHHYGVHFLHRNQQIGLRLENKGRIHEICKNSYDY